MDLLAFFMIMGLKRMDILAQIRRPSRHETGQKQGADELGAAVYRCRHS
jgi:hypothetical protein